MNLKWLPALALATQLQANVIEMPQDVYIEQLKSYSRLQIRLFDTAYSGSGWVSLYGNLNGGTLFDTDFNSLVWNLGDSGFKLRYFVINDGASDTHLFKITLPNSPNPFEGTFTLTNVRQIDLYGRCPWQRVPEGDMTLTLLTIALIGLASFYDKKATR